VSDINDTDTNFLKELGTDGEKWAKEFCNIIEKYYGTPLDVSWIFSWFANAIEAGREAGRREILGPTHRNPNLFGD